MLRLGLSCLLLRLLVVSGSEFTFELPDNDRQCFYEELEEGTRFEIGYQVGSYFNSKSWFISTGEEKVLYWKYCSVGQILFLPQIL